MDTLQRMNKLRTCKLARVTLEKMKQEKRAKKIEVENMNMGYFVDFDEFILECYNVLNTANQKGFKI
jgi:hypothetical protein